jgi:replicative DNA helicase
MQHDTLDPLPHAIIAEKSTLCAMFHAPSIIARASAEGIDRTAYHIPAHREILAHLARSRDAGNITAGGEIDLSLFVQSAQMAGILDRMGGPSAIAEIFNYVPNAGGWSAWVEMLRECKARRIAVEASESLLTANDSQEAIERATTALEAMKRAVTHRSRALSASQAADDFIRRYIASAEAGEIPGQTSGKSSSGKSVLMYQVASGFVASGKPVAIFSLELMPHEIVGRMICLSARVRYDAITMPKGASKNEIQRIQNAVMQMKDSRVWIDGSAGQTLDTIAAEAERIRDIEGGLDLIVVDYLQIVTGQRSRGESREQEIARISGGLKQLAKKMECPVITGSQLNESGQTRESRAIEQDSDALLMIEDSGIIMRKVRNGERGIAVRLVLDGSEQRFRRFVSEK